MVTIDELVSKKEAVVVVGLGYVGLPLAVELSNHFSVIGFDVDTDRVEQLRRGLDRTDEIEQSTLRNAEIQYTSEPGDLKDVRCVIVAVPTPIDKNKAPDLSILKQATETVGRYIAKGAIVVYESTVYPGATEEVCVPILEWSSGRVCGKDFFVGYSPERINPGDTEHTIDKVTKIVSAMDEPSRTFVAALYGHITNVHEATSIRVAEAAKVIENTQRDLNIALMNELAILFSRMDISMYDVLDAAGTKWNFLPFTPGLVGGHCIGVDPYYLTYKAQEVGHEPEVILAGRKTNDSMHRFVAKSIVAKMSDIGCDVSSATIVILGITFKENIPDIRNSKVIDLYERLKELGASPVIHDPHADEAAVRREYGIELVSKELLPKADVLIVAVAHQEFTCLGFDALKRMMNRDTLLFADLKHLYKKDEVEKHGIAYWSL